MTDTRFVQRAGPCFDVLLQRLVVLVMFRSPAVFLSFLRIPSHQIGLLDDANNIFLVYKNIDAFERVPLPMVLIWHILVL